ncbi:MAG: bifunctional adenosylcobinamide kinase/adenosylcobinamide-phosphate guanylyltransferase [Bacteriovoracaceae bacterium]
MAYIILYTGGCRSGKSEMARKNCEKITGKKLFLATAPVLNEEMEQRVQKHKASRDPKIWDTIEEEISLAEVFLRSDHNVILVDCLTFWVDNIIYKMPAIKEEDLSPFLEKTFQSMESFKGTVVFVTNEIGLGTLPQTPRDRKFRDFVGIANKMVADLANKVYFSVSGIPMLIKDHHS